MGWRNRGEKPQSAIRRSGVGTRIAVADSGDYWPLTVMPMVSRPKRWIPTWMFVGAILALGAGLVLVLQPDIPTW